MASQKILIIEGNNTFGETISVTLKKAGYDTTLVKNGQEGLKLIFDTLPHLIIMDIVLPGVDGYEILEKKNAEKLLAKIPVFLMSTQGVPINMTKVPKGSVQEIIMVFNNEVKEILEKVNRHFGKGDAGDPGHASEGSKKKVLWIEDDKLMTSLLSKSWTEASFDHHHAKSAAEAQKMLETFRPDIIVVDLYVEGEGERSGFELLQKLKQSPDLRNIPTIVLSNFNKPSDIEQAKALGVKRYFLKASTSLDQIVAEAKSLTK